MRVRFDAAIPQASGMATASAVSKQNGVVSMQSTPLQLSPKVVRAAHEFEASMMKELMTSLEPGHDSWEGDDGGDGSGSSLSEFAGEALSQAISERGGFGIADRIIRQLSSEGNQSGNAKRVRHRFGTDSKLSF